MRKALIFSLLCLCALPSLAQGRQKHSPIDPDDAYKNHCMRCHSAVQSYSASQTATIVLHMRVRANLTQQETQAILLYLQDSSPKPAARQHSKKPEGK